jgi:hypothetical protein
MINNLIHPIMIITPKSMILTFIVREKRLIKRSKSPDTLEGKRRRKVFRGLLERRKSYERGDLDDSLFKQGDPATSAGIYTLLKY